ADHFITAGPDDVVLEHPEHFVADLAIVGVIDLGGQRDRYDVEARLGLVDRGGKQALAGLPRVWRLGDAAIPDHVRPPREGLEHTDQPARGLANGPLAVPPDKVIGAAIGDDDDARFHAYHLLRW